MAEIVAREKLDLAAQLGRVTLGRFLGGQDALDPALGIGQGGQHGVAAEKPHRLMPPFLLPFTGRPAGSVRSVAHGRLYKGICP
jgi:hypothetical protein